MYTEEQREIVRQNFIEMLKDQKEVDGALAKGSGAIKYRDILSHIVVAVAVNHAAQRDVLIFKIRNFCDSYGENYIHIEESRTEGFTLTAFWAGGLSMRIECNETDRLLFGVPEDHCILLDKVGDFEERIIIKKKTVKEEAVGKNGAFQFYYSLRRCEMGLIRNEYIMAERQLSDAREILLNMQLINEGDNPKFTRYNELNPEFLKKLEKTYPAQRTSESVKNAENAMVKLFHEVYAQYSEEPMEKNMECLIDYGTSMAISDSGEDLEPIPAG